MELTGADVTCKHSILDQQEMHDSVISQITITIMYTTVVNSVITSFVISKPYSSNSCSFAISMLLHGQVSKCDYYVGANEDDKNHIFMIMCVRLCLCLCVHLCCVCAFVLRVCAFVLRVCACVVCVCICVVCVHLCVCV